MNAEQKTWLEQSIRSLFRHRHDEGARIFGVRDPANHWHWHRWARKDVATCVQALRGIPEPTPPTGWATPAQFKRDNPESVF